MSFAVSRGSFAQRAAAMPSPQVENWDDDLDFQGDMFANSVSTVQTSLSSRVSIRSESVVGDDDWQVLIKPNDELSHQDAITSAKHAGIPIPTNVPSSALLGGSIKRLGKKNSKPKIVADDDWGEDLELPTAGALKLKTPQLPRTPATDHDDSEDWGEGSLGIRFAGTRRDGRNRSSSASAMSPSMNSCMTFESEDDDLNGLVLPTEHVDFTARLNKLKNREEEATVAPIEAVPQSSHGRSTSDAPSEPTSQPKHVDEGDDFFDDIDIGAGDVIDPKKLTLNRNLKIENRRAPTPTLRHATTLTFTDKPTVSRIPRPMPSTKSSRLDPVYESGAPLFSRQRPGPTTTTAQLLKAKRSAPLLRSNFNLPAKSSAPFLPAGTSAQSHHVVSKSASTHFRRDSDPSRSKSPSMRSYSRMSGAAPPDTPSRSSMRKDIAPASLAREAASKRVFTKPVRKRQYGDGNELEIFDDLPTSATKESKYVKTPSNRATPKTIRHQPSISRMPLSERTTTPHPPATPRSPVKHPLPQQDSTPRFARDTAASRNAREQRLATARPRTDGPVIPVHTNWKAQVAARSPHNSPTSLRKKGSGLKPHLIKGMSAPFAKNEKGMTYNPILQRWEGNEGALLHFNHANQSSTTLASATLTPALSTPTFAPHNHNQHYHHQHSHSQPHSSYFAPQPTANPPSPPRPALISHITSARGVQVERGMVFDPARMCWLKLAPSRNDPRGVSPSVDEDDDPFAGLEDLKDDTSRVSIGAGASSVNNRPASSVGGGFDDAFAPEEFDIGPEFIRRQEAEEQVWRRRVESWVGGQRDLVGHGWRWAIRDLAVAAEQMGVRR